MAVGGRYLPDTRNIPTHNGLSSETFLPKAAVMRTIAYLTLCIGLNVAITLVLVFWVLSNWSVVIADIGSNAMNPRGIGFLASPHGLKFSVLDRAVITNSVEIPDVNESPSGWNYDMMQAPFQNKWSLGGNAVWYRTRQCLCMIAVTYPAAFTILALGRFVLWYQTKRKLFCAPSGQNPEGSSPKSDV